MTITASLATLPERADALERVVASLLPQVDRLNVRLNGHAAVPACLLHPKIRTSCGPNVGDRGKFLWAAEVDGVHLTCDDDLVYPPDYVHCMLAALERWDAVGVLAARLVPPLTTYYRSRRVVHTFTGLREEWPVHVLGTGTLAYRADRIRIAYSDFPAAIGADAWFAVYAARAGARLAAVARPPNWLRYMAPPPGTTIYERYRATGDDRAATAALPTVTWPTLDGEPRTI